MKNKFAIILFAMTLVFSACNSETTEATESTEVIDTTLTVDSTMLESQDTAVFE